MNRSRSLTSSIAVAVMSLTVAVTGAAAVGCSSDSSTSTPDTTGGGGGTGSDGGGGGTTGSLYERLGGHAGIASAVDAIVTQELADPEIASYFYYQVQSPVAAGHPSADQIKACLVNQLGNAAGGPEQYPGTPADNKGFQCRGMHEAHASLGIPAGVFDKFVTIAAGVLKSAKVSDDDIATVGSVLTGTKGSVVQDTSRDGGAFNKAPGDAGHD